MALSSAERQRAYRDRQREAGERLNIFVDVTAKRALERLARHHAVTQRAMLERLLADAEQDVVDSLGRRERSAYYGDVTP